MSVSPAYTAYISAVMGQILMKLSESVAIYIRSDRLLEFRFSNDAIIAIFAKRDNYLAKKNLTTTVLYHLELSAQRECQLEAQHPRRAHGASIVKQAQTSANVDVVNSSAASVGTSNKTHRHTQTDKVWRSHCVTDCDSGDNDLVQ